MKRWMLSISLCLFLGVLTTVGVAWALALFVDMTWMEPQIEVFPLPDTHGRTNRAEYQQFLVADGAFRVAWHEGVQRNQVVMGTSLRPYDSRSQPLETPDARDLSWCFRDAVPTYPIMHVSDARGWPMLALCAGFDLVPAGGGCRDVSRRYWAVAVMEPDGMRWLFPSVDYKQRLIPVVARHLPVSGGRGDAGESLVETGESGTIPYTISEKSILSYGIGRSGVAGRVTSGRPTQTPT